MVPGRKPIADVRAVNNFERIARSVGVLKMNLRQRCAIRGDRLGAREEVETFKLAAHHDAVDVRFAGAAALRLVVAVHHDHALNLEGRAINDLPPPWQHPFRTDGIERGRADEAFKIECLDRFSASQHSGSRHEQQPEKGFELHCDAGSDWSGCKCGNHIHASPWLSFV